MTASRPLILACLIPLVCSAGQSYKTEDFVRFNPKYKELRAEQTKRAVALGRQVFEQERQGKDMACSHQILIETKWLLGYTADFARIARRLDDLQHSLADSEEQALARKQDPVDGSWGHCYTEWFFKLDATYDYLAKQTPSYSLRFLEHVNSPQKLQQYFQPLATSNIAQDGVDHRRELNESLADLMRLILRDRPQGYRWAPGMKDAILQTIGSVRDPETGWWGERYVHDGQTQFVDDLSITFHVIRYLDGHVSDMPKVVDTALRVKDFDNPSGWLDDGHYTNHNNMDVAVLFLYGWNSASAKQRKAIAAELDKMLHWCLTGSLQPDGSFRATLDDDSVEEAEYFGTAFLARIGFFDRKRRFWTSENFPESEQIIKRIETYIEAHRASGAAGGGYYDSALRELQE